jgi:hypothetical protein
MSIEPTTTPIPIVCDMTGAGATDTAEERMAEWGRLYAQSLIGRERTADGIRFGFRADDGVEAWVRDLAAREKACCPFLDFTVITADGQVWWDTSVADGAEDPELARALLDDLYTMPETVSAGVAGIEDRLGQQGLKVTVNTSGTVIQFDRPAAKS